MTYETNSEENAANISDNLMDGEKADTAEESDRMSTPEATPPMTPENPGKRPPDMVKRIGGTTYEVSFHFSEKTNQTFKNRILRLMRRELQNSYILALF